MVLDQKKIDIGDCWKVLQFDSYPCFLQCLRDSHWDIAIIWQPTAQEGGQKVGSSTPCWMEQKKTSCSRDIEQETVLPPSYVWINVGKKPWKIHENHHYEWVNQL